MMKRKDIAAEMKRRNTINCAQADASEFLEV